MIVKTITTLSFVSVYIKQQRHRQHGVFKKSTVFICDTLTLIGRYNAPAWVQT